MVKRTYGLTFKGLKPLEENPIKLTLEQKKCVDNFFKHLTREWFDTKGKKKANPQMTNADSCYCELLGALFGYDIYDSPVTADWNEFAAKKKIKEKGDVTFIN